jgi:hypothetical protein
MLAVVSFSYKENSKSITSESVQTVKINLLHFFNVNVHGKKKVIICRLCKFLA